MSEFRIEGLEPVLAKLKALRSDQMRTAVARSAALAMRIVMHSAKAKAMKFDDPATAQSIAENIVIRTSNKKSKPYIVAKVGVQGGAKLGNKLTFSNTKGNQKKGRAGQSYSVAHWRFLEFGTSQMPAQPFMRQALESNVQNVTNAFVTVLDNEIDKIVAKGG